MESHHWSSAEPKFKSKARSEVVWLVSVSKWHGRLFFKVFRSRNVNGSLSVEICIIMVKGFFQGINGLRFMFIKSLSKEKNVHMSKVIFIVMNNNTQILNFIWMSFTIIGIQRHFTRVISKAIFQLIIQWRKRKRTKHCSVCFAQIFLFSLQMPLTWHVHSEENFVSKKFSLYWRRMFRNW